MKIVRSPERCYAAFMESLGLDLRNPHAKDTPKRVAKFFREYTQGLGSMPFAFTGFPPRKGFVYDQLITQKGIPVYSLCAHHHVPFAGKAHVGYLPDKQIVGLSKIVRAVQWLARKPSIQEDLTQEIADLLMRHLAPKAVLVLLECEHYCISMRGIQQPGIVTKTHCILGETGLRLKDEFLSLVGD